jgi:hypothetical protein
MPDNVRVVVDERAVHALTSSDEMRDLLLEVADPVVARAKFFAPKDTGRGAESITSEAVVDIDEWTVRVSWTRDQYHMYFRDRGTVYQTGTQFLERALEGVTG